MVLQMVHDLWHRRACIAYLLLGWSISVSPSNYMMRFRDLLSHYYRSEPLKASLNTDTFLS